MYSTTLVCPFMEVGDNFFVNKQVQEKQKFKKGDQEDLSF